MTDREDSSYDLVQLSMGAEAYLSGWIDGTYERMDGPVTIGDRDSGLYLRSRDGTDTLCVDLASHLYVSVAHVLERRGHIVTEYSHDQPFVTGKNIALGKAQRGDRVTQLLGAFDLLDTGSQTTYSFGVEASIEDFTPEVRWLKGRIRLGRGMKPYR